jgi:hypothetical protein
MSKVFLNLFPDDPAPPHTRLVQPSMLLRVLGAKWFDYVVIEDGSTTRQWEQIHASNS